jgi:glucose/arabinose dehydrogenase
MARTIPVLTIAGFCLLAACTHGQPVVGQVPQQIQDRYVPDPVDLQVETWIDGLDIPWELAFLSAGRALVTERPGRVRLIENGRLVQTPYLEVDAATVGEGGLLGIAVHPDYPKAPYIYLMYTYRSGGSLYNKVERYRDQGQSAAFDRLIIERIPGARYHDGGRIAFGPDGLLYITTGDSTRADLAQDPASLAGKILRLTPEGGIPQDNPFPGSPVFSYGHRNPQGLAWHPETGTLFSSEHGPSGEFGLRGHDIVNIIDKGDNYGWPRVVGEANDPRYHDPLIMWVDATPPAGMTFWRGRLYLASLRAQTLIRIELERSGETFSVRSIERLFVDRDGESVYGRLRAVVAGPDGALYVTTSNRDGRGRVRSGDDRILKIVPVK